ncbi:hypothetical protein MMYC01_202120 [Madurella mycetomatis]|uniref:Uncharacterized protein n=1 Tax=Madurella mycetomatis TaxID=100816 RepID=A0A175WB54_9PEZI|nr:hypothetical protein MMYC01_202120 [Madurella mycetomatis]
MSLPGPIPTEPTPEQESVYPDFPPVDNQPVVANSHGVPRTDAQEQFPEIERVLPSDFAAPARQAETLDAVPTTDTPVAMKTPKRRKKNTASSKSSRMKATNGNDAHKFSPSVPLQVNAPSLGQDQSMGSDPFISSGFQPARHQTNAFAFDPNQTAFSDPFVNGSSQASPTNNGQGLFNTDILGIVQQGSPDSGQGLFSTRVAAHHGVGNPIVQQTGHMSIDYSMLMKQPSPASSPVSLGAMASSAPSGASSFYATTQSSENKRKAVGSHVMETPTKRRQSVNTQDVLASSAHPVPGQNFQIPGQSPVNSLYNISPASGSTSAYGTAVKAGVCAVIRLLVREAKKRGTALSQVLIDGPATDFGSPEAGDRIKQMAKGHLAAVNAMDIESEQEAFMNGAYRTLQAVVAEAEACGSIFGKELLLGSVSGPDLAAVKQRMASMYKEIVASYTPPHEPAGNAKQLVPNQQTPTRASHRSVTTVHWNSDASSSNLLDQNILSASSAATGPATPFPAGSLSDRFSHTVLPPPDRSTAAPTIPALPSSSASQPTNNVFLPTPNDSTTPLPTSVPLTPNPKARRKPRKPRARSTTATTPTTSSPPNNSNNNDNSPLLPRGPHSVCQGRSTASIRAGMARPSWNRRCASFWRPWRARLGVGEDGVPGQFVFCQWEGVEGNLERLRCLLAG